MELNAHLKASTHLIAAQPTWHAVSGWYVNAADAEPPFARRQPFTASKTCFNHASLTHKVPPGQKGITCSLALGSDSVSQPSLDR